MTSYSNSQISHTELFSSVLNDSRIPQRMCGEETCREWTHQSDNSANIMCSMLQILKQNHAVRNQIDNELCCKQNIEQIMKRHLSHLLIAERTLAVFCSFIVLECLSNRAALIKLVSFIVDLCALARFSETPQTAFRRNISQRKTSSSWSWKTFVRNYDFKNQLLHLLSEP